MGEDSEYSTFSVGSPTTMPEGNKRAKDPTWANRKEEVEDDDDHDEARFGKKVTAGFGFQKASENVVKGRKILTAKRRTAPAASSGAFAGFGAFGGFGGAKAEEAPVAAVVPAAAEPVADAAASDWKCDVQTLSSGHSIPMVGLGTWKADKENEVGNAVKWALEAGYTHLDCASCYGNEAEVGTAFAESIAGGTKRADIFITSKLWNSEHAHVKASVEASIRDLQCEYLDLYLIHWPQNWEHVDGQHVSFTKNEDGSMKYTDVPLMDTWAALEACVDEGLIRSIGLSNFNEKQIQEIYDNGRIKPAMLQVEVHPFFQQDSTVKFAQDLGLTVTAYSPLGSGAVINGMRVIDHPELAAVGKKHDKSPAQVVTAWLLARGIVVIPKSVKQDRIKQNLDVMFTLDDEDMSKISALNADARSGWGGPQVERDGKMEARDISHPQYPFK